MSIFRQLFFASVLALAATTALAQGGPPAMPVGVAEPLAKRVTQWDEYSGRFEPVASVEVRARVSGFIDKLNFRDGQLVNVGDLLFTIDKRPFEIALESAQAEVARTKAQVELAENQVERSATLIKSRTITDQEHDQRKANLNVARAQQKAAEAGEKTAELNLDWADVRAPIAGRISDRKVDAGNLISGGQTGATLLATIVTPRSHPLRLRHLGGRLHLRYQPPDPVGGARHRNAAIRRQSRPHPAFRRDRVEAHRQGSTSSTTRWTARSGTIRVRALVDNKDQLLTPGIFGRLQLFGGEYDALLIPDSAIISDQARKIVFVGRARATSSRPSPS